MSLIQRPKGTKDWLPEDSYKWQYFEKTVSKILDEYGFKEIRVPVFEHTELFQRGVGETTDVVQKEMYTFEDKGGRSITLRPEGTAGAIRAYLENGLASKPSPTKLWYNMGMYRYENVQKGRLREFHQLGIELIGSKSYLADVETILLGKRIFDELNIKDITININSIGCPKCRAKYQEILREFIGKNLDDYCDTCKSRFIKNPMRILDCKEEKCKKFNIGAPMMIDYLCNECKEHFENVKSALDAQGIKYQIDPGIVRGLDYYTKTVFEFIDNKSGLTVLGGGRYDGLVEELGGTSTPAVGFGSGIERIMEIFDETQIANPTPDIYLVANKNEEAMKAIEISEDLRKAGFRVEKDILERSFGAQMKYASKMGAKTLVVIGENELQTNECKIKNMATGEETLVKLNSKDIAEFLINLEEK